MSSTEKSVFIFAVVIFLVYSVQGRTLNGGEDDNCGPLPPPPQNARYMKDEKSNLVVRCNDDYYRHGNPYVKCLNATWVLNVKCYKRACGHPGEPINGDVNGANYQVGATVSYQCDECYYLEGDKERTCLNNETWSGKLPECKRITCDPLEGEELLFRSVFAYVSNHKCGSTMEFECNDGYKLVGQAEVFCRVNGTWSAKKPICQKTVSRLVSEKPDNTITPSPSSPSLPHHNVTSQCRGIDYPDGGMIVGDLPNEIYDVGHVLGFACFVKYKIVGPKEVTCQANGTWSPSPPSCKIFHCNEAQVPLGGYKVGGNRIGDQYEYFCEPSYKLIGTDVISCGGNGEWSDKPPICRPVCDDVKCKDGMQCQFDTDAKKPRCLCKQPEDCTAIFNPVCGSDGTSYNNECIMKSHACLTKTNLHVIASGSCIPGGICAIKPLSLCRGYFEVFYFNIERKECEKIVVGGCHESGWNGFETIEECQDTCQVSVSGKICARPAEKGPCENMQQRWHFDTSEGKCKQFQYGGCFGNQNNFQTEQDCLKICSQPNTTTGPTTEQSRPTTEQSGPTTEQPSSQKPCPPCSKKVTLCERLGTSDYVFAGKIMEESENELLMKPGDIHRDPKNLIPIAGLTMVRIAKSPTNPSCSCLPESMTGEIILTGDYIKQDDDTDDVILSISEKDHIGKYYGKKQLLC